MEDFVAYIIKNLVSNPEDVTVSSSVDQDRINIEIRVASDDVGKVIGRRGNTINALRTIVRTVATRLGSKVQVELIQPDQEQNVIVEAEPEEASPKAEAEVQIEAEAEAETEAEAVVEEEVALT
ncbi:MAG: hypothetical protein S4CHLAM123_00690 [Chlamydiales bacterium]|nr:hypothetical protein [Chlamydiales bacterium]